MDAESETDTDVGSSSSSFAYFLLICVRGVRGVRLCVWPLLLLFVRAQYIANNNQRFGV